MTALLEVLAIPYTQNYIIVGFSYCNTTFFFMNVCVNRRWNYFVLTHEVISASLHVLIGGGHNTSYKQEDLSANDRMYREEELIVGLEL